MPAYNPWHFYAGTKARLNAGLKSQVYGDANQTECKVGTDDPTVTAQNMAKGSIYIDTTNMRAWQKMDSGSTTNFRALRADEWTKEATGFVDPQGTAVTYDTTNRTVQLSHASGKVTFLLRGRKFEYASPWTVPTVLGGATPIAHTAANGSYYLKIDPDTLAVSFDAAPWSFSDLMIAFAYKSATAQFALREVHGLLPWQAHEELHSTQGTYIKTATVPADYVPVGGVGYSTSDSNQNRPSIGTQTIYDEDLPSTIASWPDNGPYTLMYAGATTPVFLTGQLDIFPVSGGGVAQYDNSGVLTDVAEDSFFNVLTMHLPVTADAASQAFRTVFVLGQTTYTTQAAATAAIPANWSLAGFGGAVPEFVSVLMFTYQRNGSGGGAVTKRGQARLMVDPTRFVGSRTSLIGAGGVSATDHQSLSNRAAADAHPDTAISVSATYTGTLAGATTVAAALTIVDGFKTSITTSAVQAGTSAGIALKNLSGNNIALLGAGDGLGVTFYDGVNITGVLDQASATTLQIGINNATAITIGKAGITTTNAGAFTSSQLLTASLGVTLGGGTAANGKIWHGSSAIQFGNNVGSVTDAGAWTFSSNNSGVTHSVFGAGIDFAANTSADDIFTIKAKTADGSDNQAIYISSGGTVDPSRGAYLRLFGNEADFSASLGGTIDIAAGACASGATEAIRFTANGTKIGFSTQAGAWTFPVNTTHVFGSAAGGTGNTLLLVRSQTTTGGDTRVVWDTIGAASLWAAGVDKDSSTTWKLACNANADFETGVAASVTSAGAWTLGPSSGEVRHTIMGAYSNNAFQTQQSISSGDLAIDATKYSYRTAVITGNVNLDCGTGKVEGVVNGQKVYISVLASGGTRTVTFTRANSYAVGTSVTIASGTRRLFEIHGVGESYPIITYSPEYS